MYRDLHHLDTVLMICEQREALIEWLNCTLSDVNLPVHSSDDELRAVLLDGSVLCRILNKLRPGSVIELSGVDHASKMGIENVKKFLMAMDQMELPRFQVDDLEKGSLKTVVDCLFSLRAHFIANAGGYDLFTTGKAYPSGTCTSIRSKPSVHQYGHGDSSQYGENYSSAKLGEQKRKSASNSQELNSVMPHPSTTLPHHAGHKFHEVFQHRNGHLADLPPATLSEIIKSARLDNAPTQSLLSLMNGIIDESIERKNSELPGQNNMFKAREEKYESRIRVLEALASGTCQEAQQLRAQIKTETKETNKFTVLKQELEALKKKYAELSLQVNVEAKGANEILCLKQDLKITKKDHELHCLRMEAEAIGVQQELAKRLEQVTQKFEDSKKRVKDLEAYAESRNEQLNKKENICKTLIEFQLGALRELKSSSQAIRHQIATIPESYSEDFNHLGAKIEVLEKVANNYNAVLDENRMLHNEVQDLKGSIRVYCRIRPFMPGQMGMQSIVEYVGENGELIVVDRTKQGKEGPRSFKFNKVYGPTTTQVDVYSDTRPLIRSVLDGYNVCIFAYGQTGSGKTYTMIGPDGASEEDWGVNYRALNDLFQISQKRGGIYTYEITIQMKSNLSIKDEILGFLDSQTLGILTASQPNGLAVPDASIQPVQSTSDVLDLMELGLKNRAKSATSMNARSSRSHSILTIHARGTDVKTGSVLRGSLHLVDLAGSERIDRSEATGDALKEAQHINKSLSALGDVISSLSQKSAHIPYRNSKLTQVLQSSLGGHAKTLMFIQLNPDLTSFSESLSTLKFAERVSGVELGAARNNKEGRDFRELMEQVTSLKDAIAKKDEKIEQLQLLKDQKNSSQGVNGEKSTTALANSKVTSGKSFRSAFIQGSSPDNITKNSSVNPQGSLDNKRPKSSNRIPRSIPKPTTAKPSNDAAKKSIGQIKSPSGNSLGYKSTRT
ncbi:hypothetical protein DCAR_0622801 [Daucus carota subsp. sativus]|uniref:Kinesin-like protein n=1 Tax=Daucus carota subsp. sativus TaxID=79200 RepID=A0AAF0XAE8_DAUCS|nr:hypothetical protein DCAR_0622801 [Daucus carota subsp. sativus]